MRKRFKRIFSATLAGIVFCTAITFYPVETKAAEKAVDVWQGVGSADWMSNLEDDLKISQINLPGTHDSGTKNVKVSSAQCQNTSITDQLNDGVRFLDIRLEDDGEKLRLVHGTADCKSEDGSNLYLDEVLQNCYDFLDAHPTETIVMSMKKDDGKTEDAQIETYIHNYINENPGYWCLQNGSPVLKDVRKKIVLARRYHSAENDFANNKGVRLFWGDQGSTDVAEIPWSGPDRVSTYGWLRFCVQDRYKYNADDKWAAVQKGLDNPPHTTNAVMKVEDGKEITITPETTYFLNFTSTAGSSLLGSPKKLADTINANFLGYNNGSLEYGKNYGWIIMDFATEQLARHVYQSNKSPKLEVANTVKALESVIPAEVTADMKLPSDGKEVGGVEGTSIAWSCSPADVLKVNGTTASLICPSSGDVDATLRATVSLGKCSQQKEFTVKVKGMDAVFADLGAALREAEAFYEDAANAKYNLDSLKGAIETARALVQAGADKASNTQVKAATETLQTLMERGFGLKDAAGLKENLLGWYPLTSSSHDVSGNHNNGTATGVTFSKENGAAFLGGNSRTSYISLPAAMFNRTADNDNLTVSFWVKDSRGEKSNAFGFGNGTQCNPDNGGSKHFIVNTNDKGNLIVNACPKGWQGNTNNIKAEALPANTWCHLTVVMEGKRLSLYKNGVEVKTVTADYSVSEMGNIAFAYIGNAIYAHNSDKDFKGNIKDFRVYNCAVAPEQAAAIFDDNDAADTSSYSEHLLAHYPLAADGKDVSGNQYDAAATGVSFSAENGAAFTGGTARSSYLSLPTEVFDRILGNDRMTISFWVKDDQGDKHNAFGFGNGTECNPNNGGAKHFIVNTNDGGNLLVNACPKGWQGNTNKITMAAPAAGTWCHLTIVMEGRTLSLYKDGAKVNTVTADYSPAEMGSIAFAYIGNAIYAHNGDGDKDFKGNIKDFRIYDYALSEKEATGFMEECMKEELMADLQAALNLEIAKGEDGSLSMSITDGSLTLPATVCGGAATISWESFNTEVIDNAGKVTLPGADEPIADVDLTATVTMRGMTSEVIFHCSVFTKLDVDTADLQAVISSAEIAVAGLKEEDYTTSSWQALQQSLDAAKQQLRRPAGKADVDAAAADLQAKKDALARRGDKGALKSLINAVKSLKQADYTTASWTALQTALAAAEEISGSIDVSQAEVDAAKGNLESRKTALVKLGDKTNLNAAIAEAEKLDEDDYLPDTWTLLQDALVEVKRTAADTEATEEDVRTAETLLQEAVDALEKITYTVTFEPDNGTDATTVTVGRGEMAGTPSMPEKDGYTFEGWYAEGEETAFDFENTPIMADLTLTAKWKETQGGGDNPGGDNPGGDDPGNNPGGDNPGGDNPGGNDPGNNPGGDNPGGDGPGNNPGGDNPGGDNPGGNDPGNNPGGDNTGEDNTGGKNESVPVSISSAEIKLSKETLTYNGKAQEPAVTVTCNGAALSLGSDYDAAYSNNKKVGLGTVKITGKGSYYGEKTMTFTIMPQNSKISKLTNKSGRKLLVKLSKSTKKTGAKGYEISYSLKKNFKGAKKVKTTKTSYTLKKLKRGKTYYVRVRSYARIDGKTKYSAYSKALKKKISK